MTGMLVGLAVTLAVGTLVAVIVGFALTVRSIRRANRIVPGRRSAAPIGWLWSLRAPARMHRRLKRAVRMAAAAAVPVEPLGEHPRSRRRSQPASALGAVADDVARRAVAVDDWLVTTAWMRPLPPGLVREVHEVEEAAWRLARTAAAWRAQLHQAIVADVAPGLDLRSRLDAFEAAMAELAPAQPVLMQPGPLQPVRRLTSAS